MQFDQATLMKIGAAILVAMLAAVFGFGGGGSSEAPAPTATLDAPAPAVAEPSPALSSAKPAPVAVPKAEGDFDYYLLVLSWSPTHCSSDRGRGRDDDLQCRSGRPYGFVLHGLWPQHERGYPEFCAASERAVSDANMTAALKLSPSRQLVQHEWEKHGTCAGLSQDDYFAAAALAVESVSVPKAYRSPAQPLVTTPNAVRRAFLDANRAIPDDGLSATCGRNQLAEVWVCLDKNLAPRSCSAEVRRKHCGTREVRMLSVRGDWPR
ncbi:MAG: ribonuclease T2 family protein [Micropepsaceae bacterium]